MPTLTALLLRGVLLSCLMLAAVPVFAQFGPPRDDDRGGDRDRGDRGDRDRDRGGEGDRPRFGFGGGDRDRGGEGDRPRFGFGGGDQGGGFRFDPKEILKGMDANGNGLLEQNEIGGRAERLVERLAEQAKLDRSKPLSIDALAGAADSFFRRDEDRGNAPGANDAKPGEKKDLKPLIQLLVPGFGVANDGLPLPPGFGDGAKAGSLEDRYEKSILDQADDTLRRYDKNANKQLDQDEWKDVSWRGDPAESDTNKDGILTRDELAERMAVRMGRGWKNGAKAAAKPATTPTSATSSGSNSGSTKEYARSLFKRYDRNGNDLLEKDEWSNMSGDWSKADRNRDEKLSMEEVEGRLASYGSDGGSGGSKGGSLSSGGSGQLRPLTPLERLPKGLPSWFARNDANGDGQVAMAEYSATWSDSQITEYQRYDLNGDGFITPAEALQSEKDKKYSSTSSSRDAGSSRSGSRDPGPAPSAPPAGAPMPMPAPASPEAGPPSDDEGETPLAAKDGDLDAPLSETNAAAELKPAAPPKSPMETRGPSERRSFGFGNRSRRD